MKHGSPYFNPPEHLSEGMTGDNRLETVERNLLCLFHSMGSSLFIWLNGANKLSVNAAEGEGDAKLIPSREFFGGGTLPAEGEKRRVCFLCEKAGASFDYVSWASGAIRCKENALFIL